MKRRDMPKVCIRKECDRKHYAKELCAPHYMQGRNGYPRRVCAADGCENKTRNVSGYCRACKPKPTEAPCRGCGQVYPVADFRAHSSSGWVCKSCLDVERRERWSTRGKFRKYGITPVRYDEIIKAQDGRCGICKRTLPDKVDIDHDHRCCPGVGSCGECVRGVLCPQCSKALGLLGDSIETLLNAIRYLQDGGVQ
jgi:hypothetical protein